MQEGVSITSKRRVGHLASVARNQLPQPPETELCPLGAPCCKLPAVLYGPSTQVSGVASCSPRRSLPVDPDDALVIAGLSHEITPCSTRAGRDRH
jgi:hypothetical protein